MSRGDFMPQKKITLALLMPAKQLRITGSSSPGFLTLQRSRVSDPDPDPHVFALSGSGPKR